MFFNILKIDEKTKFVKDLEKEKEDYNEFLEKYKKKNDFVKQFINLWHGIDKHNLKKVKKEYKFIVKKNKKILKILKKISVEVKRDRDITKSSLFKLIRYNPKVHIQLNKFSDKDDAVNKIKYYLSRINEELNFLKKYLKDENKYIKKNDLWKSYKDLKEHGELYRLIEGENTVFNNINIHIINLLRFLQLIEKPLDESIKGKLERLRIVPVRYSNREFREFYKSIYIKRFDEEEREPYNVFEYSFKYHKKGDLDYAWHVLIAKIENLVVGGIVYEIFIYKLSDKMLKFYEETFNVKIKNDPVCFAMIYWVASRGNNKYLRNGIGTKLEEAAVKAMRSESRSMGIPISCIAGEVEDPSQMNSKQLKEIEKSGIDLKRRVKFLRRLGKKKCFGDYVQLLMNSQETVDHLALYIQPLIPSLNKAVPRSVLLTIIECIEVYSNEFKLSFLKKFPPYLNMVKKILEKEYHKLK